MEERQDEGSGTVQGGLAITPDIAEGNPDYGTGKDGKAQLGTVVITYGDDYTATIYINGRPYTEGEEYTKGVYVHFIYTSVAAAVSDPAGSEIAGISLFSARSGEYQHPTDAGTYTVRLVFTTAPVGADGEYTEASNYTLAGQYETTVIISKKQLDSSKVAGKVNEIVYTYNKAAQGPVKATIEGYSVELFGVADLYTVEDLAEQTSAGTYTYGLQIKTDAFKNYRWQRVDTQEIQLTWEIRQATNKLTWDGSNPATAVYGESYEISASADFGDVSYAYATYKADGSYNDGSDWTLNFPSAVGEYAIRAYVSGTTDYAGVESKIDKFTITPATLTVTIGNQTITYGDALGAFTLTVTGYKTPYFGTVAGERADDDASSGWSNHIEAFLNAIKTAKGGADYAVGSDKGKYTATYTGDDITLANYIIHAEEVTAGTVTVEARPITVEIEDQTMPYIKDYASSDPNPDDTKWHVSTESVLLKKDEGHMGIGVYLKDKNKAPYFADGRTYEIDGEFTANGYNSNYSITFVPGNLTLTKQDITVDSIKIYNDDPDLSSVTYGDSYTVKVVVGSEEYGEGDVLPCGATVRLLFAESILEGVGAATATKPSDAGLYEVGYILNETDSLNYKVLGINITSYNIAKKALSTEYAQTQASAQKSFKPVYTGAEQGVSAADLNAFIALMKDDENFLLAGDRDTDPFTATSEKGENVGLYAVHLKLTDDIAKNYMWDLTNSDAADINFEIEKADNSVSLTVYGGQTASWEYDGYEAGTSQDLTVEPHKGFYSFEATFGRATAQYKFYKTENGVDTEIDYTPVDVGDYKLQIVIPDTDNYAGCSSNKLTIKITPRRLTVSFRDQTLMGGEYGSTILPASAVLSYYGGEPASHNMFLSRVTLEYAYYGTSYDKTWSHALTDYVSAAPDKAGEYKIRVRIGVNETSESYAYNRNFILVNDAGEQINSIEDNFVVTKARVFSDWLTVKTFDWDGAEHSAVEAMQDNEYYGRIFVVRSEYNMKSKSVGTYEFRIHLVDPNNYTWVPDENQDWRLLTFSIVATTGEGRNVNIVEFYGKDANSPELEFPYSQAPNPGAKVAYYAEGVTHYFQFETDFILLYAPRGTKTPATFISWRTGGENVVPEGWVRRMPVEVASYTAIAWIDCDAFQGYSAQLHYTISPLEVKVIMETTKNGVYGESEPEFSIRGYDGKDVIAETGQLKPGAEAIKFFPQLDLSDNDRFLPHTVTYRGIDNDYNSTEMPTQAGTYVRVFTLSANYTSNTGPITCQFRIEPKEISAADIPLTQGNVYYDGTRHFIDKDRVEGYFGGGVIEVVGGLPLTEGVVDVREGGYAVDLRLLDTRNYVWATGARSEYMTAYFVVNKSYVELAAPALSGWSYGAAHDAPAVSGKFENGAAFGGRVIYEYSVPGTEIWSVNEPVNAGTYLVRAKVENSTNYEGVPSAATQFTIARAKLVKPTAGDAVADVGGVWTFTPEDYLGDVEQIQGNVADYDGTYRATVSITDKANFEWADGTQTDITIEWTALPNMTIYHIVVASLSGLIILLAIAAIPLGIAARRKKRGQNNSER